MVSEAIKPHAFGKASCEKDFHIGYEASGEIDVTIAQHS